MRNSEPEFSPNWYSPPGNSIVAALRQKEIATAEFAVRAQLSQSDLRALLLGSRPVDQRVANALSETVGASANYWLARQTDFESNLSKCAQSVSSKDADSFMNAFPLSEMRKLGFIDSNQKEIGSILQFFGVRSIEHWKSVYDARLQAVAFRKSTTLESEDASTLVWLREAERNASLIDCHSWDKSGFKRCLSELRSLTRNKNPEIFFPKLVEGCAEFGVALVFAKAPKACKASGATMFLNPDKAMIALSFRHLSDDHFWFSFFHEAAHLILHDKKALFLEDGSGVTEAEETEANELASEILIPKSRRAEMESLPARTKPIISFARDLGVCPGVVVGQMQFFKMIGFNQMNGLKRRFTWEQLGNSI